ncbi:MAG: cupin domain-containing protein [Myxococcota bacterium]
MIRRAVDVAPERRENMRGGQGGGWARNYVRPGEMRGVAFVAEMTLEAGTDIGLHAHDHDDELYVVLEGRGVGMLDGERFDVAAGDAWLCKAGHRHGVVASYDAPLRFLAVLSVVEDGVPA